jgi:hypothetical protein
MRFGRTDAGEFHVEFHCKIGESRQTDENAGTNRQNAKSLRLKEMIAKPL